MFQTFLTNEKIQQMTTLCTESFVHFTVTEKQSEGGREREKTAQIVSGLQNISTTRNAEQKKKRSYNKYKASVGISL